jgi:hypothetical protein
VVNLGSQLAARLKSSQSRIAKIEAGAADVSMDLLLRAFFETGGAVGDLARAERTKDPKAIRAHRHKLREHAKPTLHKLNASSEFSHGRESKRRVR